MHKLKGAEAKNSRARKYFFNAVISRSQVDFLFDLIDLFFATLCSGQSFLTADPL